jgi:uncharacterized protein (DUF111 family)
MASHVVLQTILEDMSTELLAPATSALLAAGALDAAVSPLLMKKGLAGWLVSVIAHLADEGALAEVLRETTTLGYVSTTSTVTRRAGARPRWTPRSARSR